MNDNAMALVSNAYCLYLNGRPMFEVNFYYKASFISSQIACTPKHRHTHTPHTYLAFLL